MDRFYLVAIMLFAIQYDRVDDTIIVVINSIDHERGTLSRNDYLELVFSNALYEHTVQGVTFGKYDKYFDNQQFVKRVLPF